MQLVNIENSKVVYLTQLYRPTGQLYEPEAAFKIVQRYQFAVSPRVEDLSKPERTFKIGKFDDFQISELSIYSDGFIVSSASDTDRLDAFVDDLLQWSMAEFGLVQAVGSKFERSYESYLVVKARVDLAVALAPRADVAAVMNSVFKPEAYPGTGAKLSGFNLGVDYMEYGGRRKPLNFMLDRRVGIPFKENVFYCQAPLRTKDHMLVLEALERLAFQG